MFDSPIALLRHIKVEHPDDDKKPSARPYPPEMPETMPQVPEYMPTFMQEPREVRPARISQRRHAHLGPWVSFMPHRLSLSLNSSLGVKKYIWPCRSGRGASSSCRPAFTAAPTQQCRRAL